MRLLTFLRVSRATHVTARDVCMTKLNKFRRRCDMSKPEVAKHVTLSFCVLILAFLATATSQTYTDSRIRNLDHYSMHVTINCGAVMFTLSVKSGSLRATRSRFWPRWWAE